jgi:hypothetical protein
MTMEFAKGRARIAGNRIALGNFRIARDTDRVLPYLVCLADCLRFALLGLDPYGENPDTHGIWLVYDATAYGCQTGECRLHDGSSDFGEAGGGRCR